MRVAMGLLALLAIVGGIVAIPKTTSWLDNFLAPTFADSTLHLAPSNALIYVGLDPRRARRPRRDRRRLRCLGGATRRLATVIAARFAPVYRLFEGKWYFDELIDALVVRPAAWFGRFAQGTFERVFVNGTLIGGTTAIVRAGSAVVRSAESGFVRYYVAFVRHRPERRRALLPGPKLMLSILIWLPVAAALLGALIPVKRVAGLLALGGALGSLGMTIAQQTGPLENTVQS